MLRVLITYLSIYRPSVTSASLFWNGEDSIKTWCVAINRNEDFMSNSRSFA